MTATQPSCANLLLCYVVYHIPVFCKVAILIDTASVLSILIWCMPLGFKINFLHKDFAAISLVVYPVSLLVFTGAIRCTSASTAIHCFVAIYRTRNRALWVETKPHLHDIFHLFVLLIQAGAGNTPPEEFDKCVHVGIVSFQHFWPIEWGLSSLQPNSDALLQVPYLAITAQSRATS